MTSTTDDPKQAGERVLQIAREVGAREAVDADDGAELIEFTAPQFAAFASRIRADERGECARVCDEEAGRYGVAAFDLAAGSAAENCAAAIRQMENDDA